MVPSRTIWRTLTISAGCEEVENTRSAPSSSATHRMSFLMVDSFESAETSREPHFSSTSSREPHMIRMFVGKVSSLRCPYGPRARVHANHTLVQSRSLPQHMLTTLFRITAKTPSGTSSPHVRPGSRSRGRGGGISRVPRGRSQYGLSPQTSQRALKLMCNLKCCTCVLPS